MLPVLCVIVKLTRVNVKFLRTRYLHQEVNIIQIVVDEDQSNMRSLFAVFSKLLH